MRDRKDKFVIIIIIVSVFLFLLFSKTIISGYHFVDDHEVIRIKSDLKSSSLKSVITTWVKEDINVNMRFRPAYYVHRVLETRLFGSDFILWSVYNGILCCLALVFSYLGMRNLKFSIEESIAFLVIAFIGPQSSVWWRLGPQESLGMVFLALSFCFMTKSLEKKNYYLNNLLFIFFLILSSLTKESFLIIIPAMIYFKIWNERICIWSSLKESFYMNLILAIPLAVMLIELYYIKYHVGTGYSGLGAKLQDDILSIFSTGLRFLKTYLNIIIVSFIFLGYYIWNKKRLLRFSFFPLFFFLLVIIPNLILYSKTGLSERYILPASFGLAFLVVSLIKGFEENQGKSKKFVLILLFISFIPYFVTSLTDALKFSKEGRATKALFTAISSNYVEGSRVMVIVDPVISYEISVSLKTYLFYEDNIDLFGYCLIKKDNSEADQGLVDGWKSYFDGKLFENMTTPPALLIFLDNKLVEEFFQASKLPKTDYLKIDIGTSPFGILKEKI